jgi:hypothetical protein
VFVYRNPIEVLVSQMNQPGSWTIPGVLNPAMAGLDMSAVAPLPRAEYAARVLATIANAALTAIEDPNSGGALVNYRDLPEAAWTTIAEHFGITFGEVDIRRMQEAAGFDAKAPGLNFTPDSESKRRSASGRLSEISEEWLAPLYDRLERNRLS